MWLQVVAYDLAGQPVYTSGAYNAATGELTLDPDIMVYEAKQGISDTLSDTVGIPAGPSFHFALNNVVVKDNRIPPRGYAFDAFAAGGAPPVTAGAADPVRYADGQFWDVVQYTVPAGTETVVVRLLYQVASKEYIEFLRDNNPNPDDPQNNGQIMYQLWAENGRNVPVTMAFVTIGLETYLPQIETP